MLGDGHSPRRVDWTGFWVLMGIGWTLFILNTIRMVWWR